MSFRGRYATVLMLGGILLGCNHDPEQVQVVREMQAPGPRIASSAELKPGSPPPSKATVTLSGTPFDVTVVTKKEGSHVRLVLMNKDEEMDTEEYQDAYDAYRLIQAGGEKYEPPIDLLKFPMQVGDDWEWKGKISSNGNERSAIATVETFKETYWLGDSAIDGLTARVTLRFPAMGGEEHAERILSFTFSADKGLFRRQYGTLSVREPAK